MPTHFLDIANKIKDLQAVLLEYENSLYKAEQEGNDTAAARYRQLIRETENKIDGMRNSPYYNG